MSDKIYFGGNIFDVQVGVFQGVLVFDISCFKFKLCSFDGCNVFVGFFFDNNDIIFSSICFCSCSVVVMVDYFV